MRSICPPLMLVLAHCTPAVVTSDPATDSPQRVERPAEAPPGLGQMQPTDCAAVPQTLGSATVIHRLRADSNPQIAVALTGQRAGDDLVLSLHTGECTAAGWRWSSELGAVGRTRLRQPLETGSYPDLGMQWVEVEGDRLVQIRWRHPPGSGLLPIVDRRSVRWFRIGGAVSLVGECTIRDLRAIDGRGFLQGHDVSGWRVVPESPPRLVGDRTAGAGYLRNGTIEWTERTDQRRIDVALDAHPEVGEICL